MTMDKPEQFHTAMAWLQNATIPGVQIEIETKIYNDWLDTQLIAEQLYYELYGRLPEWNYVLESVEEVEGSAKIWVHRSPVR